MRICRCFLWTLTFVRSSRTLLNETGNARDTAKSNVSFHTGFKSWQWGAQDKNCSKVACVWAQNKWFKELATSRSKRTQRKSVAATNTKTINDTFVGFPQMVKIRFQHVCILRQMLGIRFHYPWASRVFRVAQERTKAAECTHAHQTGRTNMSEQSLTGPITISKPKVFGDDQDKSRDARGMFFTFCITDWRINRCIHGLMRAMPSE